LIELTVVILVLLTLIGVLFIGANIYKRGADRAACILNIRNIQQAVRANQNLNNLNIADTINYTAEIFTPAGATPDAENYLTEPDCPRDSGPYTQDAATYPETGDVAVSCSTNGSGVGTGDHFPVETEGW